MNNRKQTRRDRMIDIALILGIIMLAIMIGRNFPGFGTAMARFGHSLVPFIIGFALCLMLKPVQEFLMDLMKQYTKWSEKVRFIVSIVLSISFLLILIVLFFVLIIPQLSSSVVTIANNMNMYARTVERWLNNLYDMHLVDDGLLKTLEEAVLNFIRSITATLPGYVDQFIESMRQVATGVWNAILGLIISVYFMTGYERISDHAKRAIDAFLPDKIAMATKKVISLSINTFTKFIAGKALDSLIIMFLCMMGCLILRLEYPYLIAFVVGITNMIPFFGPFIGAVPCLIILLFANPWHSLWFLIFIVALQQFDGNVLGPRILGGSLGIPGIMIIFSVLIGGQMFGIFGMFLGVPLFSLIYFLLRDDIHFREQRKREEELKAE